MNARTVALIWMTAVGIPMAAKILTMRISPEQSLLRRVSVDRPRQRHVRRQAVSRVLH